MFVDEEWLDKLPAMEEDERDLLEDSPSYQPASRLSCQLEYTDQLSGLKVTIAPEE